MKLIPLIILSLPCLVAAQAPAWQQAVDYKMEVALDVNTHRLKGRQSLTYFNHSPDTLPIVFFHLQFNAFQPGSMMDVRSRHIEDPDTRIGSRISKLTPDEIGYQKILSIKQDGKKLKTEILGTIMKVWLRKPLLPQSNTVFAITFEAQVPLQIRRCGRKNREGIEYSMSQWYPKIAEYDYQGWHANQYIAREFHSVWGDFDVTITLDSRYTVAATGALVNAAEIGHGYSEAQPDKEKLSWHFQAKNVLDFTWAADPDYQHETAQVPNGPTLHFFYQKNEKTEKTWPLLKDITVKTFQYLSKNIGPYPYDRYSVIQAGDGGMEYSMCTLLLGEGPSLEGLAGLMMHEVTHTWFEMLLASNEILNAWMDEGFTEFASKEAMAAVFPGINPHLNAYRAYFEPANSGKYIAPNTPSDFFPTNAAYRVGSYVAGNLLLCQLRYIMGEDFFWKGLARYFHTWKMKHPGPDDFIRCMEKVSGMQLLWFKNLWINSTQKIDYALEPPVAEGNKTRILIKRIGDLPMPVELTILKKNGSRELHYIPMNETISLKPKTGARIDHPVWYWVNPSFELTVPIAYKDISSLELDADHELADVNRSNDKIENK